MFPTNKAMYSKRVPILISICHLILKITQMAKITCSPLIVPIYKCVH